MVEFVVGKNALKGVVRWVGSGGYRHVDSSATRRSLQDVDVYNENAGLVSTRHVGLGRVARVGESGVGRESECGGWWIPGRLAHVHARAIGIKSCLTQPCSAC
jgi:hypothetical protein